MASGPQSIRIVKMETDTQGALTHFTFGANDKSGNFIARDSYTRNEDGSYQDSSGNQMPEYKVKANIGRVLNVQARVLEEVYLNGEPSTKQALNEVIKMSNPQRLFDMENVVKTYKSKQKKPASSCGMSIIR